MCREKPAQTSNTISRTTHRCQKGLCLQLVTGYSEKTPNYGKHFCKCCRQVGCETCPVGHYSKEQGATRVCTPCGLGEYQSSLSSSIHALALSTQIWLAATCTVHLPPHLDRLRLPGEDVCLLCDKGRYAGEAQLLASCSYGFHNRSLEDRQSMTVDSCRAVASFEDLHVQIPLDSCLLTDGHSELSSLPIGRATGLSLAHFNLHVSSTTTNINYPQCSSY